MSFLRNAERDCSCESLLYRKDDSILIFVRFPSFQKSEMIPMISPPASVPALLLCFKSQSLISPSQIPCLSHTFLPSSVRDILPHTLSSRLLKHHKSEEVIKSRKNLRTKDTREGEGDKNIRRLRTCSSLEGEEGRMRASRSTSSCFYFYFLLK